MEKAEGLQFKRLVRPLAYQEVVEKIKQEIMEGRLKSGDRLPGERQLGELLGVSRTSVREALRVLETLDIIRARRGTGPESGSIVVGEVGNAMSDTLLVHTALDHLSLSEMVEVRLVLEGYAVEQAANRAGSTDIEALEGHVRRMSVDGLDAEQFLELDSAFHIALARASGNRLNAYLMQSIRRIMEHALRDIYVGVSNWEATRAEVTAEHMGIVRAISDRDGAEASRIVRDHIKKAYLRFGERGTDSTVGQAGGALTPLHS